MIPLEQGSVFRRLYCLVTSGDLGLSQSLWNRAVSSDTTEVSCTALDKSQSLWNRAVSSDGMAVESSADVVSSQSLWNRAVSSDIDYLAMLFENNESQSLWNRAVSSDNIRDHNSEWANQVSIPLEQGSVFRHITQATNVQDFLSQSLWNRAVSSDLNSLKN